MRRLLPTIALVAVLLFVPVVGAFAVESGEVGGPEPTLDGEFAPPELDRPFWDNAAVLMAGSMVGLVGLVGVLYWAMVLRPERAKES